VVKASYNATTASGNQDITGFGFNPTHVIGFATIASVEVASWGFSALGAVDAVMYYGYISGSWFYSYNHQFISMWASGGRQTCTSSAISDGVRLAWTKTSSPTGTIWIQLIGWK
jgi:hypothetical protein